jgi:dihydrofolate reductase
MELAIIVAQSRNSVIGVNNDLPWRLPKDLQYFKRVTLGKPIIMGRKTYESIGKPLPGRTNIVITSNTDYSVEGVQVVHSLEEAVELGIVVAKEQGQCEVMVIGGAQIYQQALEQSSKLYITEVDAHIEGDAHFPEVNYSEYREVERENHASDESNPYDYSFVCYERVKND